MGHCFDEIQPFIKTVSKTFDQKANTVEVAFYWINELIVDVYATLIMGYAYLFSLIEFQTSTFALDQSFALTDIQEYNYPSLRMRIYFILKTIERDYKKNFILVKHIKGRNEINSWSANFRNKLKRIRDLVKVNDYVDPDLTESKDIELRRGAWDIILKLEDELISHAFNFFKDKNLLLNYNLLNLEIIENVIRKFDLLIPINEVYKKNEESTYLSPPLIINCGWIRYLNLLEKYELEDNQTKKKQIFEEIGALNKLIKRSVESATFHKEFIKNKNLFK